MKKYGLLKFILAAFAVVFLANQIFSSVYKSITTESAVYYTYSDGLKIIGVIIRNEMLVESENNGVLHFMVDDGKRVSKDGVVANIYNSESASITLSEIDRLKTQIADIQDILSYNDIDAANLELINNKISDNFNDLIRSSSYGNFSNVYEDLQSLLSSINRRQAAMGQTDNFAVQLQSLNEQLTKLNAGLPQPAGEIKAKESGYFLSKTDGYETILTTENLEEVTPEFLSNLEVNSYGENVVGKIVSDYEWYIAAEVSLNESMKYKEGDSLEIHTSVKSSPILPVTVEKINVSNSDSKAVVIFACSEMNTELASMRSGPMTVVSKTYSGLKVPKKALRVIEYDKKGVYILSGMQVKFVEVEIIYSNDDFIICEKTDQDGSLKLYDQVIVKGKKLYDGKIVG